MYMYIYTYMNVYVHIYMYVCIYFQTGHRHHLSVLLHGWGIWDRWFSRKEEEFFLARAFCLSRLSTQKKMCTREEECKKIKGRNVWERRWRIQATLCVHNVTASMGIFFGVRACAYCRSYMYGYRCVCGCVGVGVSVSLNMFGEYQTWLSMLALDVLARGVWHRCVWYSACLSVCLSVCPSVCRSVPVSVCIPISAFVCVYLSLLTCDAWSMLMVSMCVCVCVCMCVCENVCVSGKTPGEMKSCVAENPPSSDDIQAIDAITTGAPGSTSTRNGARV